MVYGRLTEADVMADDSLKRAEIQIKAKNTFSSKDLWITIFTKRHKASIITSSTGTGPSLQPCVGTEHRT